MGYFENKSHIVAQVASAIADSSFSNNDVKYIFLDGSTNDLNGYPTPNVALGEISDKFDTSLLPNGDNFAGSFERVAKNLTSNFPNAIIIYVRVHNMSSRSFEAQKIYGNLAKEICEKWGISFADIFSVFSTQTTAKQNLYLTDLTHPNDLGYEIQYIPVIENDMLRLTNV